ncbi:MAG: hypothetical protein ACP5EN_17020, partial [Rhodovulum sp.]
MARTTGRVSMMALAIGTVAILGTALPAAAQGAGQGQGMGAGQGAQAGQARGAALFDRMDADDSGTISLEEFTARARARFADLDDDGDGAISAEEAQDLGPAGGGRQMAGAQ